MIRERGWWNFLQVGGCCSKRYVIAGLLEGIASVGGLSALGAGLYSVGVPKDSIIEDETALKADHFLAIVHGTVTR
jgi:hypothetical protein